MKPHRLFTLLAIGLLCAASPHSSPAVDVAVDISSFAPRDPNVVVRQIELNVAIKQYEKVLMEVHEARLQYEFGTPETGFSDDQQKQWKDRAERKLMYLENMSHGLRDHIRSYVAEANKEADLIEKTKAEAKAKSNAAPSQPKVEPSALLQGRWEGVEVGRESEGKCTMTITGNSIHFQGANENEWYKATFALPEGKDPRQLHGTITDCPAPEFVGKSSFAIYKIEDGKLTLAGHRPGGPDAPKGFEGDADSRTFVFKKAQP